MWQNRLLGLGVAATGAWTLNEGRATSRANDREELLKKCDLRNEEAPNRARRMLSKQGGVGAIKKKKKL